jgi:hypothetical protein
MIENWKELVGYQTFENSETKTALIFYMITNINDDTSKFLIDRMAFSIIKESIVCDLTEEEMCKQLDKILVSFPESKYSINSFNEINKAKLEVARKSYRAFANTRYKNSIFYRGTGVYDAPVIVAELNGLFGIFLHPKFSDYGFVLKN